MSDSPARSGLIALAITGGVVLFGVVLFSFLQDPDRPPKPEAVSLQEQRLQQWQEENGPLPGPRAPHAGPARAERPAEPCDPASLSLSLAFERPALTATITNPCAASLSWQSPTLCVVDGVEVQGADGAWRPEPTMCAQALGSWTLDAGASMTRRMELEAALDGARAVRARVAGSGVTATVTLAD